MPGQKNNLAGRSIVFCLKESMFFRVLGKKKEPEFRYTLYQNYGSYLVELRGIEPLSESNLTGFSPGAVCYFHSLGAA